MNNIGIARSNTAKFLGFLIDCNLTWKDHIEYVTKKISKNLGIIKRIPHCLQSRIKVFWGPRLDTIVGPHTHPTLSSSKSVPHQPDWNLGYHYRKSLKLQMP